MSFIEYLETCLKPGTDLDRAFYADNRCKHTHLMLFVLKLLLLPGLLRGFIVMQSQACCNSIELGTNTTGTSKLAPSLICISAARMENRHTITHIFKFSAQKPNEKYKSSLWNPSRIKMIAMGLTWTLTKQF